MDTFLYLTYGAAACAVIAGLLTLGAASVKRAEEQQKLIDDGIKSAALARERKETAEKHSKEIGDLKADNAENLRAMQVETDQRAKALHAEAERMNELRKHEIETMIATRAEIDVLRKRAEKSERTGGSASPQPQPKVAVAGLEATIANALRELSPELQKELLRREEDANKIAEAREEARARSGRARVLLEELLQVISSTLDEAVNAGLTDEVTRSKWTIPTALVIIPNDNWEGNQLGTITFKSGTFWNLTLEPARINTKLHTVPQPYHETALRLTQVFPRNEAAESIVIRFTNRLDEDAKVVEMEVVAKGDAQARMKSIIESHRKGKMSSAEALSKLLVEMLKLRRVGEALQR